jgi:hypothetical protein
MVKDITSLKLKSETHARLRKYMHHNELDSMDAAINLALDAAEKK